MSVHVYVCTGVIMIAAVELRVVLMLVTFPAPPLTSIYLQEDHERDILVLAGTQQVKSIIHSILNTPYTHVYSGGQGNPYLVV